MTTLNISLPDPMKAFIDEQIAKGGYSTASEYIRHLIRQDQEKAEQTRLEALVLDGLNSGTPVEVTDIWWEQKRAELLGKLRKQA